MGSEKNKIISNVGRDVLIALNIILGLMTAASFINLYDKCESVFTVNYYNNSYYMGEPVKNYNIESTKIPLCNIIESNGKCLSYSNLMTTYYYYVYHTEHCIVNTQLLYLNITHQPSDMPKFILIDNKCNICKPQNEKIWQTIHITGFTIFFGLLNIIITFTNL